MSVAPEALFERLQQLERELLQLRRELGARGDEALPDSTFRVVELWADEVCYGLPVSAIRAIIFMVACRPLPEAPPWVAGTFRLGQELLPLIDLPRRLGGRPAAGDPASSIVVLDGAVPGGLAVHRIGELVEIDPAEVVPPASGIPQSAYIHGALPHGRDRLLYLLSVRSVMHEFALATS